MGQPLAWMFICRSICLTESNLCACALHLCWLVLGSCPSLPSRLCTNKQNMCYLPTIPPVLWPSLFFPGFRQRTAQTRSLVMFPMHPNFNSFILHMAASTSLGFNNTASHTAATLTVLRILQLTDIKMSIIIKMIMNLKTACAT